MRFKKGDKVEFIYGGTLTQGVVNEIRATNHDISYQIVYFGGEKKIWFAERDLLSPAPVLKVPKLVGDFLENHSKEDGHTLHDLLCDLLTSRDSLDENVYDWIMENNNENGELLARAWLDGYEVEKEPLYYVQLIRRLSGYLNVRNDESSFLDSPYEVGLNKTKFTEAEIKAMDERYWQFAVPVKDLECEA
ncbi:DUF1642 domain-containing protein [Listeria monocytogenes]|nr:DUF1642 domain-containing protein [Listeria monocytogenes]EIZ4072484.1 DUF1642 domain-containing protein [Listeria monocytogenes]EIZ4078429.1 DUF1642 domain-containing protein [Listeria monocytogenes]